MVQTQASTCRKSPGLATHGVAPGAPARSATKCWVGAVLHRVGPAGPTNGVRHTYIRRPARAPSTMSDDEARPGVFLDKANHELILNFGNVLNLKTMQLRTELFKNYQIDQNTDIVELSSFEDLVLECNNNLGNPPGVATPPALGPARVPATRTTTRPPPPPPPQPPLITGSVKYDAFWHEAEETQTLIYATAYDEPSKMCKWCTVRLQPDGRVATTANDVPINVYTSFAAKPGHFQNYDQKTIVRLLYYGHKPLQVYLEAMFRGEEPPAAPPGPPAADPAAADTKAAIAFFFKVFTSQDGLMTDAEFGRYHQFVRAAHDQDDVRRSAESQATSLPQVMQWHAEHGGTTDRLPQMMQQFMNEWKTFLQVKDPDGENVEIEDERKERGEEKPESSHHPAAGVRRLGLYLKQTLGQGFDLDEIQEGIAQDFNFNDPTQFYRCIVLCLDNRQLLTILWHRPRDLETLTGFLHVIKPESSPDDQMSTKLYALFTCIVNVNYQLIPFVQKPGASSDFSFMMLPDKTQKQWNSLNDAAQTSITEFVDTVYGDDNALREQAAAQVRNFELLMHTAHVYQLRDTFTELVDEDEEEEARIYNHYDKFVRVLLYDAAPKLLTVRQKIEVMHAELSAIVEVINQHNPGATDIDKFNVYFQLYTWRSRDEWPEWQDGSVPQFNFVNLLAIYNDNFLNLNQDQSQGGKPLDQLDTLFRKLCERKNETDITNLNMGAEQITHYYTVVDKDKKRNDMYPPFWKQADMAQSIPWKVFRDLYYDAQFASFARTDIARIQDSYELPTLVDMVFARFATGSPTKLPYNQLQAIFQSAELHDVAFSDFCEAFKQGNEDVAQSLTREQFTQGIANMPGIAINMEQQLTRNENLLKGIFNDCAGGDVNFMTLDQLNTCLQGTGETPILARNFKAFCNENKLVQDDKHFQIEPPAITKDGFIVYFSQTKNMITLKALIQKFEDTQGDTDEDFDGEEY